MNFLLLPISFLYHIVLNIRHKLFDWHILKSKQFEQPVICLGNLALGGTGKTPHVEYLIDLLSEQYRVCVVSRGYGRKTKGFQLASDSCCAETVGDEPLQYATKYNDVLVAVDENRNEAIELMNTMDRPPELFLLDDAFQHRRTQAGLNILLTDNNKLYSNDFLIPAGTLRDVRSAAQRAQIVIVTKFPKTEAINETTVLELRKQLKLNSDQKLFISSQEHEPLKPANQAAKNIDYDLDSNTNILCFSGIANSKPLIEHLNETFGEVKEIKFQDHHRYGGKDVQRILNAFEGMAQKEKIIVTTEKDYARFINSPYLCQFDSVPLFVAPISVSIYQKEEFNKEILDYVRKNHHHS